MNTLGIVFLIIAATMSFFTVMLVLTDILKVLKTIDAKLLNMEMTIRKSPDGAYIRTRDGA